MRHVLRKLLGILIEERSAVRANFVQNELRGIDANGSGALVGDGDIGAQLPSRIVQRDLYGNTVDGEGLDEPAIIHELVAARSAFLPTGDAICKRCRFRAPCTI